MDSRSLVERVDRQPVGHPERMVPLVFLLGIAIGTVLLMLPVSRAGGLTGTEAADFITALFTATSAFCVTGLTVVDTSTYWSPFGQVVLLGLFQVGGIGIMTSATLLGLLVTRSLPLSRRLHTSVEIRSIDIGDVRQVLRLVLVSTLAFEGVLTAWLTARFWSWGMPFGEALWQGFFHACSAFTNTGFSILSEGLAPHRLDVLLLAPLMIGVIAGGIGFPIFHELRHHWRRPRRWSIHTKLTFWGSLALIVIGTLLFLAMEWGNPETLGDESLGGKILGALFHSVMTRSGGFAVDDMRLMHRDSMLMSSILIFIGGGSASTAGGIRITTFLLLGFSVWSEIRGRPESTAFHRRIAPAVERRAVAILLLALAAVLTALIILSGFVHAPVEQILFEVVSAFATGGLSTGLSASMPVAGKLVMVVLMYVGRFGPELIATLALTVRHAPYRYPEERPIVG